MLPRVDSSGAGSAPGDMASQSQQLPIADAPDDYGSSGSMPLFVRGGAGTETVMSRSHTEAPGAFPRAKLSAPLMNQCCVSALLA